MQNRLTEPAQMGLLRKKEKAEDNKIIGGVDVSQQWTRLSIAVDSGASETMII